jgi:hypothetical protein
MDASFVISGDYTHLFSFTDTLRTYPVLHQLKTGDKKELVLDPLSKLRIRKHKEIMKRISSLNPFNQNLFNQRDSLYAQHSRFTESVTELRSQIEKNISLLMKDKQVEQDVKRYEGEKRGGKPEGKGLQVLNGSIYSGSFEQGKFISGNVVLKNEGTEYYGQFANSNKNGTGWLKYANGSYLLGIFKNNELFTGVALQKGSDGEIYFGGYNGKRNGYGELQNNSGKYVGIFSNGRLIKGYTKEIDPFGYYTYSIIEGGAKNAIEAKTVEAFFGLMLSENN